nr:MBOAT family protein [Butyrivibrio sp.]
MLFNSYDFILLFLPICLLGYYSIMALCRHFGKTQTYTKLWLIAMSLWCYGAFGINYLVWFMIDILAGYLFVKALYFKSSYKKTFMVLGVVFHIGLLLYFKYTGLFADTLSFLTGNDITVGSIILPVGISFFTFSQISYLIDNYRLLVHREQNEAEDLSTKESELLYEIDVNFVDYLLYISFFPKLLQGPIVSYKYMNEQFQKLSDIHISSEKLLRGFILFTMGLAKKVLLADTIGAGVDYGFSNISTLTNLDAFIVIISYTFQLYFDFSGYCDMGRGICNMMGLDLPDNFYLPYQARNIEETWKKWHISLTRFFTKYLYIPMGGNRKGMVRMYLNLMIVFLVSGLWHGAGWNFVVWGFTQGALYLLYRFIHKGQKGRSDHNSKGLSAVCILLNHCYWAFSFTFFRAANVTQALEMFKQVVQPFKGFHITYALADSFYLDEIWYVIKVTPIAKWTYSGWLCMWIVLFIACLIIWIPKRNAAEIASMIRISKPVAIAT